MRAPLPIAFGIALLAGPALAQDADCSGFKWPMNRELTAFKGEGLPEVANGGALPGVVQPVVLKLVPQDQVTYPVEPGRKPKQNPAYGGTFTLPPMASADTYQLTLSADAWIDVVEDGKTLKQVGYTGSHTCKIVRKSVRFTLGTAPATIEISDAAADSVKLDVLPKEQ